MRPFLRCAAFLALAFASTPALACINDREVHRNEQEFRARYDEPAEREVKRAPAVTASLATFGQVGLGAVFLAGGLFFALRPARPR